MKSLFEQNGGTYTKVGDYYIPDITVPDTKEYNIGKYGRLHRKFLKENYPAYYSALLMTGKLLEQLEKIDCKARNELDRLIPILAEQQGVTEQLKAENQLKWVGLMNNIKAQVEEIIYSEIVYVRANTVKD